MKTIRKLLIANRGEIAVRIARTARAMGIRTVAIYSDADAAAPHVRSADEAVHIGASPATESYLSIEKVVRAAQETRSDAIHPGYGFLSERPEFVEACEVAGTTFIGPSSASMRLLGDKIGAKALAVSAGVPVVPGFYERGAGTIELLAAAERVGYPVLLKASAGGGGRGMRVVSSPDELSVQLALASQEALSAFGDGTMMLEKLVVRPRHVEVQFVSDSQGTVACLFERDCSVQRRHQKLIEEAPSPASGALWPAMRDATRTLVLAARYVGAGTAEFIVDDSTGQFYFLEVNARLQVEHPVTEAITGLDLIRLQLDVASGRPIGVSSQLLAGDRQAIDGHAIEARIVAEDPENGFRPSTGRIVAWAMPRDEHVRVDTGYEEGMLVTRFYDSLLAKIVVHAASRQEAIAAMRSALLDCHVLGVHTNIGFLIDVIDSAGFSNGALDTGLIDREFASWSNPPPPPELEAIIRAASRSAGPWGLADSFRNSGAQASPSTLIR